MLLAGDIGGTKTLLAVFSAGTGLRAPLAEAEFASKDYSSLSTLVAGFLAGRDLSIDAACFAIAGPVLDGTARLTNLPWAIDAAVLRRDLAIGRVDLINDVEAIARAVPLLRGDEVIELNAGQAAHAGTIAVIAAGTGLGEAFMTWEAGRYVPHPSEGGHADFAPADSEQARLLEYVRQRVGHVSVERVCSGIGLPNIYEFLRDSSVAPESRSVSLQLSATEDRTRVILDAALAVDPDALSVEAIRCFVSILAAEAGNLALKVLATGGIYLAGGIPPLLLPFLLSPGFIETFCRKGRMRELLARVPVHVVAYRYAALMGAAAHGLAAAGSPPPAATSM